MTENIYSFLDVTLATWKEPTLQSMISAMKSVFDEFNITPLAIDCKQTSINDEDAQAWQYSCVFDFGDFDIAISTHTLEHSDEVIWINFNNEYPVGIANTSAEKTAQEETRHFLSKKV